ncbi:MAG: hypothetical protein GY870_12310 [archaeon]|nr:hypothetical protein [archaeon]
MSTKNKNKNEELNQLGPKFMSAVFFVKDIGVSKKFYVDIIEQKILMDHGKNVGFEGGFAIWEGEYALKTIFQDKSAAIIEKKSNFFGNDNAEIYFEITNLDAMYKKVKKAKINFVHEIVTQPWLQRVFRIYDPDNYIVEFGEPMYVVILRLKEEGISAKEISEKTSMPLPIVNQIIKKFNQ